MKPLRLVGLGVALFLIAVGAAWLYPADSYLLLPDSAKPLAPLVKVEGEKPHPPGGISYVDVIVRQASVLEELVPFTRPDGADLVPEQAIVPPGSNYAERRRQNLRQMDRSQKIAAAVALRELGYDVEAKPEGALIVDVAPGSPADGKIEATEVIVGVDGKPVKTPDDLRRLIAKHKPGETVTLSVRAGGATRRRQGRDDREPCREGPADHRCPGRAVCGHHTPDRRRDRPRRCRRAVGRARVRARHRRRAARRRRPGAQGGCDGRVGARRVCRPDRRREAEGDRREALRRRCLPCAGWG